MASQYYTDNDVISSFCEEERALDEIIMDGSDDDLGFDDEIEIEDDDGKVENSMHSDKESEMRTELAQVREYIKLLLLKVRFHIVYQE